MSKKVCILVLGMHRSGTSSLAGSLDKLGISFGQNISAPSFDNPKGYFENNTIQDLNDRVLKEFKIEWDYPGFLPTNWHNLPKIKAYDAEASEIIKDEFGKTALIAIKDPRICYLLPFWKRVLKKTGYTTKCVFSYRNPDEIALSLAKRNNFSINKGQVLSATHLLSAEQHSRDLLRTVVKFGNLIQNPTKEIKKTNKILKLGFTDKEITEAGISKAIDKKLKHHNRSKKYSNKHYPSYMQDHEKLWSKVLKSTSSFKDLKAFDKVREEHQYYTDIFYDGIIGATKNSFKISIDTGKGFNEKQTIKKLITDNINTWQNEEISRFEDIKSIKLTPANTLCAINLKYLGVVGARKNDYTISSNAYYNSDDQYYFDTAYPEILIEFKKPKQISKLPITIEYLSLGKEVTNLIQNVDFQRIIDSKDLDIQNFEDILKDRDHYLNLKDNEISELTHTVLEYEKIKDTYEERYQNTITAHNEELDNLKEALDAERNRFALEHKEKIEATNLLKDNIDSLKDQKNAEANQLRELLENEQKDKLVSLEKLKEYFNNLLKEKENELTAQKLQLAASIDDEKNDKIGQLESLRSQFGNLLQEKDQEIKQLQKEIHLSIENERNDKSQKMELIRSAHIDDLSKKDNEWKEKMEQMRVILEQKDNEIKSMVDQLRVAVDNEKNDKYHQLDALKIQQKEKLEDKDKELKALAEQLRIAVDSEKSDKVEQLESLRAHFSEILLLRVSVDNEKNDKTEKIEALRSNHQEKISEKDNEKDQEIKQLHEEIRVSVDNEKNDKIQKLEILRTSHQEKISEKDNEIKALSEQLRVSLDSEKGDKLSQLEGLRAHFSELLLQKDQEIKQLNEQLRVSLDNEKTDKNAQLGSLRDALTKEKITSENELNAVIANYREQLIAKENELNEIRFKLLDDLNREKTEKVEQISAYRDSFFTQLTDKENELRADLKKALEEKNRVVIEHKDEMFTKENDYRETLNQLRKEAKNQYEELRAAKEKTILELQADILKLKEQVSKENYEKLKSVSKLHTLIEKERLEKKNEFTLLQAQNEREVDELVNSNNRLMLDISDLKQTLLAKINEGEYAEQVVDTMNEELDVLKKLYQLKEQEIHEIRKSLSFKLGWTITAPARIVYNVATGAKKTKERSKLFLELAGNGIKNPKKMLKSLNRENISTLKKALSSESPELIVRNYKHHLSGENSSKNEIADEKIVIEEAKQIPQKKNDHTKNILFISPNLPDFDESAGGKRAWYMLKLLQEEYQVYAYTKGQKLDHHRIKLEQEGIIIIDTHNFHAIKRSIPSFNTIIFGWYYTLNESGKILEYYPDAKVIVDTVDIHWIREERSIGNWDGIDRNKWQANKLKEIAVYKKADSIWVVSETDADAVRKEIPDADLAIVSIIENIKKNRYLDPETNNILFLGGYRHYPNITAATSLAKEIFPKVKAAIPNATLTIAGSNAPEEIKELGNIQGVNFKGFINDEDIPALYSESFIAVVPLKAGAGVKGKICEAISYALPVVTNAIGNEGINLEHNEEAFITESTEQMASHIISAMKREVNLAAMTKKAQEKFLDLVGPEVNKARMMNSLVKQVSICIVTYNKLELLQKCISSIHGNTNYPNYKILVHSNGCTDGTKEFLTAAASADSRIIPILSESNDVFVLPNNGMMNMYSGNDVVLLNNDVEVTQNWLTALVDTAYSDKNIGVVGSKILFPDGKLQEFGGVLYSDGTGKNIGKWEDPDQDIYKTTKRASFVSGCSFYIKRSTISKIGVFDERFHPCYCEDADYCYTAWENNLEVVVEPASIIFHFEGATSGTDTSSGFKKYQTINMEKFHKKHGSKVDEVNEKVARLNDELITV